MGSGWWPASQLREVRLMKNYSLNINGNRKAVKYSLYDMLRRVLWGLGKPVFSFSPRPLFAWRAFLLRQFGAKVGRNVHIYNSATIYFPWNFEIGDWSSVGEHVLIYNLGKIIIGEQATISHRAHLCAGTHDFCDPALPLLKQPITIGDQAWICADAFISPNISIGQGAIVGARAVVTKDVEPWAIVAGNPAKYIKTRVLNVS